MNLAKAMATVAGLTGLSRIAGFVRDVLTAAYLGAGPLADAFFVALKLPNFFRRVTAEGAFSVAFVPLYSKELERKGGRDAGIFAGNAFMIMLLGLSFFTMLAVTYMPYVITAIAPGFIDDPQRFEAAVELSRITFPYLLLMSLSALLGGMMNAHDKFAPFAFAPVLFNMSIIVALLFGTPWTGSAGHAMAWGIFLSGFLQFFWLMACLRRYKIRLLLQKPRLTGEIRKLFRLMGPGVIGAGVMHINLFADMIIASMLSAGSISYLYYASRLNQLPLGMVGIAVGTALLPMLSRALASHDGQKASDLFNRSLEYCLLLALPAAAALLVVPDVIIKGLFERGEFTSGDTQKAAFVLQGYAIGLPAYIFVKVFSTAYWSREDTKTPVKISIITTVLNICLSLILIWPLGVAGIAFSTGLMGWLQVYLLKRGLKTIENTSFDDRLKRSSAKIVVITCIMAVAVYSVSIPEWGQYQDLLACVVTGSVLYGILVFRAGLMSKEDIKTYLRRTPEIKER